MLKTKDRGIKPTGWLFLVDEASDKWLVKLAGAVGWDRLHEGQGDLKRSLLPGVTQRDGVPGNPSSTSVLMGSARGSG
jgi:hypothetical protein